jgi:hypothetical protein
MSVPLLTKMAKLIAPVSLLCDSIVSLILKVFGVSKKEVRDAYIKVAVILQYQLDKLFSFSLSLSLIHIIHICSICISSTRTMT